MTSAEKSKKNTVAVIGTGFVASGLAHYLLDRTPGFRSWRDSRLCESRDYLVQIENGVHFVLMDPDFERHFLPICEKTRLFWSRVHSAGLVRRVPFEARWAAEQFVELIGELISHKDELIAHWEGDEKKLAKEYFNSMERRRNFVELLLNGQLEELHEHMVETSKLDVPWTRGNIVGLPTDGKSKSKSMAMVLLCGALEMLSKKLLSWMTELENEAGPYARSVYDHRDLCVGLLDLFCLILHASNAAAADEPEMKDHFEVFAKKVCELKTGLRDDVRTELNRRYDLIGQKFAAREDLEALEEDTRKYLKEATPKGEAATYLQPAIRDYSARASELWREVRNHVDDEMWAEWYAFQLSPDEPEGDLSYLMAQLEKCSDLGERNELIEQMVYLDVDAGLDRAGKCLSNPEVESEGFFELQLGAMVYDRLTLMRPSNDVAERIVKIIEAIKPVSADRYSGPVAKNRMLGTLVAIFAVLSEDDPVSLERLRSILTRLGNESGEGSLRTLFFQGFLDRAYPFLVTRNWKLMVINSLISEDDVVWPNEDIFKSLRASKTLAQIAAGMAVSA